MIKKILWFVVGLVILDQMEFVQCNGLMIWDLFVYCQGDFFEQVDVVVGEVLWVYLVVYDLIEL